MGDRESRHRAWLGLLSAALACWASAMLLGAPAASAWAPAASAPIHPGSVLATGQSECTSNFVYSDGAQVYLGQAAHCASAPQNETNGCRAGPLPLGTPVTIAGASRPGTLAYSSWITMRETGVTDPYTCAYNDFALVRVAPEDIPSVNPSVPGYGGPTGVGALGKPLGTVYGYGSVSGKLGLVKLNPKAGG